MNLYAYILQRMAKIKLINTPMFSGVRVCVSGKNASKMWCTCRKIYIYLQCEHIFKCHNNL